MITAPTPARRDSHHAAIRAALDRIDELLDPADPRRGLGAALALVMPHARGLTAQARLALAARCVAQRIRQEAADDFLAIAAPFLGRDPTDADRATLNRRLLRKVRELRLLVELRLPGRLARADEALGALAASSLLGNPLKGFILTTVSQYQVLDAALVGRLEALSPLLASPRAPLATLTARCAALATRAASGDGDGAAALFNAFAAAQDELAAACARLRRGGSSQEAQTLAALERPGGLLELAILSIGSTPPGPGQRHTRLCHRLAQALSGGCGQAVTRALAQRKLSGDAGHDMLEALMRAWSAVAHQGACLAERVPAAPAPGDGTAPPAPLARALQAYFDET